MHISENNTPGFPLPYTLPSDYKTGPRTDSTTHMNLNRVAAVLVNRCIFGTGEARWQPTGQHDGIRVLIWSTDSQQDTDIEDESGETRFMNPVLDTSGNSSGKVL